MALVVKDIWEVGEGGLGRGIRDVTIYQLEKKHFNNLYYYTNAFQLNARSEKKICGVCVMSRLFNVTRTLAGLVFGCSFKP